MSVLNRLSDLLVILGKSFIYTSLLYSLLWYFHEKNIGYSYLIATWDAIVLLVLVLLMGGLSWFTGYLFRRK